MTQGELALWSGRRAPQQAEAVRQPIPDLDRAHGGHAGRRQLDPERQAVDGLADLGHRRRVRRILDLEVGSDGTGPIDEQGDGVGRDPAVHGERAHRHDHLTGEAERLA